jgi:hypothetical protein
MTFAARFFTEDISSTVDEYERGFMMYGSADALAGRVAITCMLDYQDSMLCLLAYLTF